MAVAALLFVAPTSAHPDTKHPHPQHRCSVLTKQIWQTSRWRREHPKNAAIIGWRRLKCPKAPWAKAKHRFYKHRKEMRWLAKYRPFVYPDGSRWAVPYPIAICESGGNYFVGPSGAYGLIPPLPQWQSPKRQDEIAHDLYLRYGESPWAPYEGGCYLR